MSDPNNVQPGGNHYKKHHYQHWDLMEDNDTPYLPACATKYVSRWRDKNGNADLEKAVHYLEKAIHVCQYCLPRTDQHTINTTRFTEQLDVNDKYVVVLILNNYYAEAIDLIHNMMGSLTGQINVGQPDSDYTNQDPDLKES